MSRSAIFILIGLAAAALVAARLGGPLGGGVLAGYLVGASVGMFGILWQRSVIQHRPKMALAAMAGGFGLKFAGLLAGALALRFVNAFAAVADWRTYLVTYAVAAALALALGIMEVSRLMKGASTP